MKIFLSAGEPSGDLHGSNLIRDLREAHPGIQFTGFGGPKMKDQGCELLEDLTQLAVMWVWHVITNIKTFWDLYKRAGEYFAQNQVDAVVLIDYPGFNWWVARQAKKHNIPVFYYGAPQIWAWARWRVKKMKRLVDHVLCKLPFEKDWYKSHGCNAHYIGHPYYDEMERHSLDQAFVESQRGDTPLIAVLPGSRTQEVVSNLPGFLKAIDNIRREAPTARFAIAAFNEKLARLAWKQLEEHGGNLPVEVHVDRTQELIEASHCCLACSGSVSLELLYRAKPTVILYKVSWLGMFLQRFFRKVKHITLVNLLAAENPFDEDISLYDPQSEEAAEIPFPEYLTSEDKSDWLAYHVLEWLEDQAEYNRRVQQLEALKAKYAQPGASAAASSYILRELILKALAQPVRKAAA